MTYDYTCYFDGACEPKNPGGAMGIGAVILDKENNRISQLSHYVRAKPENSNNVAEYQGFGWLVTKLNEIIPEGSNVLIMGDSKLVVEQMNGNWNIKAGAYVQFAHKARPILEKLKEKCFVKVQWIPRENNSIADDLSKSPMIANNVEFKIQPNK